MVEHHVGGDAERARWPRLDVIPFESDRQFMATLRETSPGAQVIYLKGAPEVVVPRCQEPADGRGLAPGDVLHQVEEMAARGLRVLALAARRPESPLEQLEEGGVAGGFTLLGLQGMIDPPRPEAIAAIEACRRAGITVKMITGDHKGTAKAIGRRLGLLGDESPALTGSDLDGLSDDQLRGVAGRAHVLARVAPEHKWRWWCCRWWVWRSGGAAGPRASRIRSRQRHNPAEGRADAWIDLTRRSRRRHSPPRGRETGRPTAPCP